MPSMTPWTVSRAKKWYTSVWDELWKMWSKMNFWRLCLLFGPPIAADSSLRLQSIWIVFDSLSIEILSCAKNCVGFVLMQTFTLFHFISWMREWITQPLWYTTQFTKSGRDLSSLSNSVDDNWKRATKVALRLKLSNRQWNLTPRWTIETKMRSTDYKLDDCCRKAILELDTVSLTAAAAVLQIYLNYRVCRMVM